MVITRQVWMAAAVAGSAGCLALAPVCLALGKADAPVEITFKTILGMKMAIRDEKEIQLNEAEFAVQKFSVQKPNLPNLNTPWPPFMLSSRAPSLTPMIRSGTSPTVRTRVSHITPFFELSLVLLTTHAHGLYEFTKKFQRYRQ